MESSPSEYAFTRLPTSSRMRPHPTRPWGDIVPEVRSSLDRHAEIDAERRFHEFTFGPSALVPEWKAVNNGRWMDYVPTWDPVEIAAMGLPPRSYASPLRGQWLQVAVQSARHGGPAAPSAGKRVRLLRTAPPPEPKPKPKPTLFSFGGPPASRPVVRGAGLPMTTLFPPAGRGPTGLIGPDIDDGSRRRRAMSFV